MTVMDVDELYSEFLLDHFKHPKYSGVLEHPDLEFSGGNPLCGDQIALTLQLSGDIISAIRFSSKGCAVSKAAASMVTEAVINNSVQEALKLDSSMLLEKLGSFIQLRQKCALLPLFVLQQGLKAYQNDGCKKLDVQI